MSGQAAPLHEKVLFLSDSAEEYICNLLQSVHLPVKEDSALPWPQSRTYNE